MLRLRELSVSIVPVEKETDLNACLNARMLTNWLKSAFSMVLSMERERARSWSGRNISTSLAPSSKPPPGDVH